MVPVESSSLRCADPSRGTVSPEVQGAQTDPFDTTALKVADDHLILVLMFDSVEAASTVSQTIGGPLMREHVIPLLASPTERSIGEAIFSLGI